MTLKQLKDHFESFPDGTTFPYSLSEPFSWRGIYADVAFAIDHTPMTKEKALFQINTAYSETFIGYKGGEFKYRDYTDVHFEHDVSSYTDGTYCAQVIANIEGADRYNDQEERLVKLAFIN